MGFRHSADFIAKSTILLGIRRLLLLQPGDSCIVTLRDGIWGYPVIQNLQPVEKSVSPHRDIKSLLDHLKERRKNKNTPYGQNITERVSYCRTHGNIEADSLDAKLI